MEDCHSGYVNKIPKKTHWRGDAASSLEKQPPTLLG